MLRVAVATRKDETSIDDGHQYYETSWEIIFPIIHGQTYINLDDDTFDL